MNRESTDHFQHEVSILRQAWFCPLYIAELWTLHQHSLCHIPASRQSHILHELYLYKRCRPAHSKTCTGIGRPCYIVHPACIKCIRKLLIITLFYSMRMHMAYRQWLVLLDTPEPQEREHVLQLDHSLYVSELDCSKAFLCDIKC